MPSTFAYPFDPTGVAASNKIINEQQILTVINSRDYQIVMPKFAPFFAAGLIVKYTDKQGNSKTLVEGQDYTLTHMFIAATKACAKPVYGSILFYNATLEGVITLNYQTIGGEWTISTDAINNLLSSTLANPRVTSWDAIVELPATFPVIDHQWDLIDLVGLSDVIAKLVTINESILIKGGNASLATYTRSQIDAMLAQKLSTDGKAASSADSDLFDGRTFLEVMTEILTGTAADSNKLSGMTLDQLKSLMVSSSSNALTLQGSSLNDILNSTVANSQKLSGKTLTEILIQAQQMVSVAGSAFANQATVYPLATIDNIPNGWTQIFSLTLANNTNLNATETVMVSVAFDDQSEPGLYLITLGYNLSGTDKYTLSVVNLNRNDSAVTFCYDIAQTNGVDSNVYVYAKTATNRPTMTVTGFTAHAFIPLSDTFRIDEPANSVYAVNKEYAYTTELTVISTDLTNVNTNIAELQATTGNHESRIESLETSEATNETNITTNTQAIADVKSTTLQNSDSITSLVARVATAENNISTNNNNVNSEITSLTNTINSEINTINSTLQTQQTEIDENTASIQGINQELNTLTNNDVSLQQQITTLSQSVGTGSTNTGESITAIQADVTSLKNSRTTDEGNISNLQTASTSHDERITTNENNISSIQTKQTQDELNITNLQSTVSSLGNSLNTLGTNIGTLSSLTTAQTDSVVHAINSLKSVVDSINGSLAVTNTNVSNNTSNISDLTTRVTNVEGSVSNINNELTTFQPKDGDLTAIAGFADSATGILTKTGANTWALTADTSSADLTSIANLPNSTGLLKKVSTGNWTLDTNSYLTGITQSLVTTALGYTPLSNVTGAMITAALGYAPLQSIDANLTTIANLGSGATVGFLKKTAANTWAIDNSTYITSVTSAMVTTALGFTPLSTVTQSAVTSALANSTVTGTLTVTGNFTCNATITAATDIVLSSDERLKTNWRDNYSAHDLIKKLAIVKSGIFDFKNNKQTSLGVSAQSLKEVLPEAVTVDDDGYLAVRYSNAALYAVIKLAQRSIEQDNEISVLKAKIKTLEHNSKH